MANLTSMKRMRILVELMATALLTGAGGGTRRGGEGVVESALEAAGGERRGRVRVR